jgi:serine/threonine protein kinase
MDIWETPTVERRLSQMTSQHSSQAYDNHVLSKFDRSTSLAPVSDFKNRPNGSGFTSINDQQHPTFKHDIKHILDTSKEDGNGHGSLTELDHDNHNNYLSVLSEQQLADEENVRLASLFNAQTPALYIATEPFQIEDQCKKEPVYQHIRMLGHGGSASVEKVRDTNTGCVFARKIIRNVYSRNLEEAKRKLLNEVGIMQRLASHHHIVRVHSTRIEGRELTMILDPVADGGDLAHYLQNYRDQGFHLRVGNISEENADQNRVLRRALGCLASALDFIHRQTVRHKDIKPQNILIHKGKVMYTDFGLSYDFGDVGRSTTTGNPQGITKRYCAPEVAEWERRNTKSDVFSLGCVFIGILLALANDASYDAKYEGNFEQVVRSYTNDVPLPLPIVGGVLNDIIQTMMRIDSTLRPSAYIVTRAIFESLSSYGYCSSCNLALRADPTEWVRDMSRS